MRQSLSVDQLYRACEVSAFDFQTSAELDPVEQVIGQTRALEGFDFGVGITRKGYNIYVMGATGYGRHTLARQILESVAARSAQADDWCYVANFDQPHQPRALRLPSGRGRQLQRSMEQLIEDLLSAIPAAFHSDTYHRRAQEINDAFKKRQEAATAELNRMAREKNVTVIVNPSGYAVAPVRDGKILTTEEFNALPADEQAEIEAAMAEIEAALKKNMNKLPVWQREMQQQIKALNRETSELTVGHLMEDIQGEFADLDSVADYLKRLRQDVIENAEQFVAGDGQELDKQASSKERTFNRYRVNLLVNNAETQGAPVVYEDSPTYQNLSGRVEHLAVMGTLSTDFTLIKSGALHRANGGYLILDALKVLSNPFSWEALKRALGAGEVPIEALERRLSLISTVSLEPEPIPIDLKVILIGERYVYYLLKAYDPEFGPLFKVAADFAVDMPRSDENQKLFAQLIAGLQQGRQMRPFKPEGVAGIIEAAVRWSNHQDKISLKMEPLVDLMQEADYCADRADAPHVGAEHVRAAREQQIHRLDQIRERMHEAVLEGTLLVDTHGVQLAQVNGLSVAQLGDFAFGMPTRISATARMGAGELVDIEREVEQGGSLHSKGVLILGAYLAWRYAKEQPLSVAASLVFEQTYGGIEGDSASVAELCALLSALADIPLRQSLAVTGSVSQHGEVQAIGGVCEKIEGFFAVCKARGLRRDQGVIIPQANIKSLMLHDDVREAVAAGQFHIYAVNHVEEAMELLTGLDAGRPDASGRFPIDTINGKVQSRLAQWTALRQHYSASSVLSSN